MSYILSTFFRMLILRLDCLLLSFYFNIFLYLLYLNFRHLIEEILPDMPKLVMRTPKSKQWTGTKKKTL